MIIQLSAFGNKLVGYLEVPENTTPEFKLVLTQPIQLFNQGNDKKRALMECPLHTICVFSWTGETVILENRSYARVYVLTRIEKQ